MKHINLFENYSTQKDLELLTNTILKIIAQNTFIDINDNTDSINDFSSLYLKDINPESFKYLEEFLYNFKDLEIHIVNRTEFYKYSKDATASYLTIKDNNNTIIQRLILLKENESVLELINNIIHLLTKDNKDVILQRIIGILQSKYKSHLIHELKHAYDDYISGNKKFTEPKKYNQKIENLKDDEADFLAKHYIETLNLPYETDARFSSAIASTKFYTCDLDKSFELNKDVYAIKPFNDALLDFKRNMFNYKLLIDSEKKRVLKKFSQFYELEKEFVNKLNK